MRNNPPPCLCCCSMSVRGIVSVKEKERESVREDKELTIPVVL